MTLPSAQGAALPLTEQDAEVLLRVGGTGEGMNRGVPKYQRFALACGRVNTMILGVIGALYECDMFQSRATIIATKMKIIWALACNEQIILDIHLPSAFAMSIALLYSSIMAS